MRREQAAAVLAGTFLSLAAWAVLVALPVGALVLAASWLA